MADYELMFIVDPRLSDEETVEITDGYRDLLIQQGAEVTREESWGKRKLAYEIHKLNEGKYHLYHVTVNEGNPFVEVEHRMHQNDKVLRYLTVRVDAGRLRHRGSTSEQPAVEAAPVTPATGPASGPTSSPTGS
jgi:small subunit ribosomal protein S6